ncbi:probable protein phosphatase 2C 51 [Carica papaya]|uniref:probable protein phosphatase 2C 51 n=1 Tax=Carica papaya TaxID=3649 RepID=UPI000B8CAEA9|nr:probable protein phosphatase 2C 51 [Carica papaya]
MCPIRVSEPSTSRLKNPSQWRKANPCGASQGEHRKSTAEIRCCLVTPFFEDYRYIEWISTLILHCRSSVSSAFMQPEKKKKKIPRLYSPSGKDLRQMTSDMADEMSQLTMIETKNNGRRKRLPIRRVKYTYQTRTQISMITESKNFESFSGNNRCLEKGGSQNGESNSAGESTLTEISLSVLSSSTDVNINSSSSGSQNGVVSSGFGDRAGGDSHGWVSLIGMRREMEDTVKVELGFVATESGKYDFFGVYDGHGGARVAEACRERLHRVLGEEIAAWGGNGRKRVDWEKVMEQGFERMDEEVRETGRFDASVKTMGSTAVVAVVGKEEVVVANCGDSRAVIARGGSPLALSTDHKPDRVDELERIEGAGGRVINWNGHRVLGVLATSRSIGDQYLKPFIISKPEVIVLERTEADEFLILASDGLWDVVSNEEACRIVRKCLNGNGQVHGYKVVQEKSVAAMAALVLAELAMARGSRDNISVVVVELNRFNFCKYI